MKRLTRYLWPIALCMSVGFSASLFQREAIAEWYPFLNKPVLTPPNGAFPIVWGILYILIGISLDTVGPELLLEHRLLLFAGTLMGHGHHPDTRCGGTGLYLYHIQKGQACGRLFHPLYPVAVMGNLPERLQLYLQLTQRTSATVSAYRHVRTVSSH